MMSVGLEQARVNIDRMRNDLRYENRKFLVQFWVAIAASVGAGVALADYVNSRHVAPPPQVIYLQPILPSAAPPAAAH